VELDEVILPSSSRIAAAAVHLADNYGRSGIGRIDGRHAERAANGWTRDFVL